MKRLKSPTIAPSGLAGPAVVVGLVAALAACEIPGGTPHDSSRISPILEERLKEIDRLAEIGRLRRAIEVAELALVDHHLSSKLRDHLAELRSIRQVWYTEAMNEAETRLAAGAPRTAVAILRDIEGYGDDEMVQKARFRAAEIAEAHPAILLEDRP